jgi:hypothetical protein
MVWRDEMVGECGFEDSRGEQIDIELLLRRVRLCDHGLMTMDRVGDGTWRGIPSGKNVMTGGARGAVPIQGEWGVSGDGGRKEGEVGVVGCMVE